MPQHRLLRVTVGGGRLSDEPPCIRGAETWLARSREAADVHQERGLRLRRQAPHPARRFRSASTRGGPVARGAHGLCHDGRGPQGRARLTATAGRAGEGSRLGAEPACWAEGRIGVGAGGHGPRGGAGPYAPASASLRPRRPGRFGARDPGNPPKLLLSPDLCPSCASYLPPLPPACACVYSSPSRRTPAGAAARTPRTGYCGRRRRSDRPFRTGFIRWLEEEGIPPQAPVFHEFLESIF